MLVRNRRWTAHRAWSWVTAAAVVALMLAVFAAPMAAAANGTTLSASTVTPRIGSPTTTFVITVVYANDAGSPAERVAIQIGDRDLTMSLVAGAAISYYFISRAQLAKEKQLAEAAQRQAAARTRSVPR